MKTVVAFQGERGAFSEAAAQTHFGSGIQTLPLKSFEDVFRSVIRGRATYGIVPIENSLYGSIHQNYDLLQKHPLKIVGEVKLRVVHALMANKGVAMRNVNYIYSHPQALGQCDKFLGTLKDVEAIAMYDTAGAAKF